MLPFEVTLTFPLYAQHERLVYRRDALDTVARRDMVALNPSLRLKHKAWSFTASWTTTTPDLQQQMRYRDTRNPLYITEGNPSLRNTQKLDASMRWSPKKDQHISSSFVYYRRSVAQGFTYNPLTSAYTYRPENVRGNWTWNTSADLSVALDKKQQWWLESHTEENTWHSVDYTAMSGMNDAQLNRVETVNLGERLRMRYMNKHTKVGITGNVGWRRTWGHRPSQESISAVDFNYGMTLEHTLATWKTTFNVDAGVYSRRGYSSHAMNKDDCLVNASVSQPLFHGRLTLKLEGHDLLYQLTNTSYEVNAQGRTEAWHRVIPNYVMLHAIYNFSRTPRH